MPDLLLELFCEEIPARMQRKAASDLQQQVTNGLVEAGLIYEGAKAFWTPRRLTLSVNGITAYSPDQSEERKGPSTNAPQKAIDGFLRAAGLGSTQNAIIKSNPKKGDYYVAMINKPGRKATEILTELVPDIIQKFPWPKSMRWGPASLEPGALRWVRPLHSVLCTFGPETEEPDILVFDIGGIVSGNVTWGHRFHAPQELTVRRFQDYCEKLEKAHVILDPERRKNMILCAAKNLAFAQGLDLVLDEALLEEVAGLVEWPVVLMGAFNEAFLNIPPEVIQRTIRVNQKCFVLKDQKTGVLTNKFIIVSNIQPHDGGKQVIKGNERVVRARLSDAKFFFEADLAVSLNEWAEKLSAVTFHEKLGTQAERVARLKERSRALSKKTGADPDLCLRAAALCKADLMSAMVFEFPELQGVMGRYYAAHAGEDRQIIEAMDAHYRPQGPGDSVPKEKVALTLALADKLDMVIGFWSVGEKPTGSKDPFALRRAALGIIRIILENEIRLNLKEEGVNSDLLAFFHGRLKVFLRGRDKRHDLIDAVINAESDDLWIVVRRIEALGAFLNRQEGQNLLAGYKRSSNILAEEEKKGTIINSQLNEALLSKREEKNLAKAIVKAKMAAKSALLKEDFEAVMQAISVIRQPVDAFFETVLVNDADEKIRMNRLSLLQQIRAVTHSVADFSKIEN